MVLCPHIKAKGKPDFTPLSSHLEHVGMVVEKLAEELGFDKQIAKYGAILHDIGKASPIFQERLLPEYRRKETDNPFRHELASFFFISLFDKTIHPQLIEMIVAHHKSVKKDARGKGILDLEDDYVDVFEIHKLDWDIWSKDALEILDSFGIPTRSISIDEAENNYYTVLDYVERNISIQGYSEWKGLLMAADHFGSAMINETKKQLGRTFKIPDLSFYSRKDELYPLSLMDANSSKRHTIVVACTGAGKTDFLFRRCRNRVFYTLPYQASINAMYNRIAVDLAAANPNLDIRLLHSASRITIKNKTTEEKMLQGLIGSSVKVLTPHQIAGIIFGTRAFEASILDLKGCDIILDEIHTYTEISRAIVLKMVEVLNRLDCKIHIGTATMPTDLYNKILDVLGEENVYQIGLSKKELDEFNRHIVYKIDDWQAADSIVEEAVTQEYLKVLVVCNRVKSAQKQYEIFKKKYENIPILLIHSRFKRGDRNKKEKELVGLDSKGNTTFEFNTSNEACIVISTQVVEVSLDISFDIMITETAPLDALIQRFGRINRKRSKGIMPTLKPIYIVPPPNNQNDAWPYNLNILRASFEVLPNGELLRERDLQHKIDTVFPDVDVMDIETHSIFKKEGHLIIDFLTHRPKSYLFELLEIESVSCIIDDDIENYEKATFEDRTLLEIPVRYWQVKDFPRSEYGNKPFIVPSHSYCFECGFNIEKAKQKSSADEILL